MNRCYVYLSSEMGMGFMSDWVVKRVYIYRCKRDVRCRGVSFSD